MNDQKTKKTPEQKKHVFQVHTMHSDNEAGVNMSVDNKTTSPKGGNLQKIEKKQTTQLKQSQQPAKKFNKSKQQTSNPFLENEEPKIAKQAKKSSFAPGAQKESVEKINQTPADIVPPAKIVKKNPKKTQKKMIHVIMIAFIILFLLGIVGFGIYMLKFNTQKVANESIVSEKVEDILVEAEDIIEDVEKVSDNIKIEDKELGEQLYATNLPNYLAIDVESATTQQDIMADLEMIAQNMQKQNMKGPISFVVTDQNSNPVSFHVFSMSAGMNIPQNMAATLEEGFEIYAYNDDTHGVRFGFVIDVKDVDMLRTAISASEAGLPKIFNIILNDLGMSATGVVFGDNSYETHPVRYYNLDQMESYSVDYTINDKRLLIGTTKDTLRAIIDSMKKSQLPVVNEGL